MFATNYPLWDVFVTTAYVVLFVFWLMLVFHVLADIMRSHDLTGAAKALWVLFIFVLPLLGCLFYLILRGGDMHLRQERVAQMQRESFEDYIRHVATTKDEHTPTS